MKRFALRSRKGFTLIELVVVIALMAILTASAVELGQGIAKSSKNKAYLNVAQTSYNVCQIYMSELNSGFGNTNTITVSQFNNRISRQYVVRSISAKEAPQPNSSAGVYIDYSYSFDDIKNKYVHKVDHVWYIDKSDSDMVFESGIDGNFKVNFD